MHHLRGCQRHADLVSTSTVSTLMGTIQFSYKITDISITMDTTIFSSALSLHLPPGTTTDKQNEPRTVRLRTSEYSESKHVAFVRSHVHTYIATPSLSLPVSLSLSLSLCLSLTHIYTLFSLCKCVCIHAIIPCSI